MFLWVNNDSTSQKITNVNVFDLNFQILSYRVITRDSFEVEKVGSKLV